MIFAYLTLATALIISLSAAVYSILGLTAIFAAAFWPIVIMGGSLEVGKIVTTLWLHKYWKQAEVQYKLYLCTAVAVLMLLTSMGVFGFLSKAHSDQGLVSGDVTAKIAIYDEKIKIEKDNIDANRKALKQMDEAVDQVMARSTSEGGADKAVAIRRSQQKERGRILAEIAESQKKITSYNEERAPIAAEVRKVDAEVGPIKYIAALVYGDNPDANILEKAVRWVIILIVIVFDPLALTLLLAATKALEWERGIDIFNPNKKREEEEVEPFFIPDEHPIDTTDVYEQTPEPVVSKPEYTVEDADCEEPLDNSWAFAPQVIDEDPESEVTEEIVGEPVIDPVVTNTPDERPGDYLTVTEPWKESTETQQPVQADDPLLVMAKRIYAATHPNEDLEQHQAAHDAGEIDVLPWHHANHISALPINEDDRSRLKNMMSLRPDNLPSTPGEVKGFGIAFPSPSNKGDMFLRVDKFPNVLYKYNGKQWIKIDKKTTDTYIYNEKYIDHLIDKIGTGEYDFDLLSDAEREQITQRLAQE